MARYVRPGRPGFARREAAPLFAGLRSEEVVATWRGNRARLRGEDGAVGVRAGLSTWRLAGYHRALYCAPEMQYYNIRRAHAPGATPGVPPFPGRGDQPFQVNRETPVQSQQAPVGHNHASTLNAGGRGLILASAGVRFAIAIAISLGLWAGYFWATGALGS